MPSGNIRALSWVVDFSLDEARGHNTGRTVIQKFGRNPSSTASTSEAVWDAGGVYTGFLQAAAAVRIKAGGNAADAAAGAGAQSVTVVGLDETWAAASEDIACNADGTLVSDPTTTTFIRVYRAYVSSVGTYGAANTGDVTLETTGAAVVGVITATFGQTQQAIYTVPLGKEGYVRRFSATVEGAKPADVSLLQRQNADDVTTPFSPRRIVYGYAQLSGQAETHFESYPGPFPAKTDIWVVATAAAGAAPGVSANFDVVLVDT